MVDVVSILDHVADDARQADQGQAMSWYVFFLFLHILTAILAFGTAMLAFPFIGAFAEKESAHVNFAFRLSFAMGRRGVTPLALATFGFGIVLIVLGGWNPLTDEWLLISIILFLVTVVDAQLMTLPTVRRLAELTASPAESATGTPSADVSKLVRKVKIGGTTSAVLLATITLLMVWKPGS
jgi:uncharacterized membrane protein